MSVKELQQQIELEVVHLASSVGRCQFVTIALHPPQSFQAVAAGFSQGKKAENFMDLIEPGAIATLQLPAELDLKEGIILNGRAPNWLYAHLVQRCQAAPWIGFCNVRESGAVVVHSRVEAVAVGDTIKVSKKPQKGMAIMVGGPPDSGKSVFSYALQRSLRRRIEQSFYLHRANWDREGNWAFEGDRERVNLTLKEIEWRMHLEKNGATLVKKYLEYQAEIVDQMRSLLDVVLVDVGGRVQAEKDLLVEACTHSIVISGNPKQIPEWQQFFGDRGLSPIAVIQSVREECCQVLSERDSSLVVRAGRWERGETMFVPDLLVDVVVAEIERYSASR